MSRTIKEFRVVGKSLRAIEKYVGDWLGQNKFEVKERNSKGHMFTQSKWWLGVSVKITPHRKSTVGISLTFSGCIVFEVSLSSQGDDSIFHGEFYEAGAGPYEGAEWGVDPNPGFIGKLAKKIGYQMMVQLLESLESFSGRPLTDK